MNIFLRYQNQLIPYNKPGTEIETIFDEIGHPKEQGFTGFSVSLQKWNKLLRKYNLTLQTPIHTIDYIDGDLRKTVTDDQKISYLTKTRIPHNINFGDYPLRLNIKEERNTEYKGEFKYDLIRDKTRYEYFFPDGSSRLDLTRVITTISEVTALPLPTR